MNCLNCGNTLRPDVRFCPSCGTAVSVPSAAPTPDDPRIQALEQAVGRKYRIVKKIGSGGFADVYLGEHTQLGRLVAIKFLSGARSEDDDMVERFRRESKAAAKLSHPNIIDIYDVGESGEFYYFVMKYISGETLGRKMRREKKLQPGEAIDIVAQIADALAYAHDHDVVHRDIKPANVMLDEYGKPVLMDFGIARVQVGGQLTRTGALIGTPHYLPPEQPLGKTVDGRSDIYSLGIMFYEMLAGRVPFHDDSAISLIYKHINEPPPPLQQYSPDLPADLCAVVHKMIEKLQENRYQSAEALLEALEGFAGIYSLRATPSAARRSTPSARRSTEKIMILARQHSEENKIDKAMELYRSILQRHPDHKEAKEKLDALTSQVAEGALQQIQEKKFDEAKQTIARIERVAPNDPVVTGLRYDLEREEQRDRKESEFRNHYEAAALALKHDHAGRAVEHLTKALTINPESPEATDLLRQARGAYEDNRRKAEFANAFSEAEYYYKAQSYDQALAAVRKAIELQKDQRALDLEEQIRKAIKERTYRQSEEKRINEAVDQLCESLDFAGAIQTLQDNERTIPEFAKVKRESVERNRDFYQQFQNAEQLFAQKSWQPASSEYQRFTSVEPPYDYQVFYRLRKEAEEKLKQLKEKIEAAQVEQDLKKADVLLRMGQADEAVQILQKYKDNADAQNKLQQIREMQQKAAKTPDEQEIRKILSDKESDTAKVAKTMLLDQSGSKSTETEIVSPPKQQPMEKIASERTAAPSIAVAPPPPRVKAPVVVKKRAVPNYMVIGGVAILFAAIVIIALLFWNPSEPETAVATPKSRVPSPASSTSAVTAPGLAVSFDAVPWAQIEITSGSLKEAVHETTPCHVMLPPGQYNVVVKNPQLSSFTQSINVNETHHDFRFQFPQMDAERLANSVVQ